MAVFCHDRRSPDGKHRLVLIWMAGNGIRCNASGASPDNQVEIMLQGSVVADGVCADSFLQEWIAPQYIAEKRTTTLYARIYAGQVDPKDETHFTVHYEIGEYSDDFDGYLMNDGSIAMFPRKHRAWANSPEEKRRREWENSRLPSTAPAG
jgi:hypothetical protein